MRISKYHLGLSFPHTLIVFAFVKNIAFVFGIAIPSSGVIVVDLDAVFSIIANVVLSTIGCYVTFEGYALFVNTLIFLVARSPLITIAWAAPNLNICNALPICAMEVISAISVFYTVQRNTSVFHTLFRFLAEGPTITVFPTSIHVL